MNKIIEFKKVSKIYKLGEENFHALDNISFDIKEGELIVILGPSGARKIYFIKLASEVWMMFHQEI